MKTMLKPMQLPNGINMITREEAHDKDKAFAFLEECTINQQFKNAANALRASGKAYNLQAGHALCNIAMDALTTVGHVLDKKDNATIDFSTKSESKEWIDVINQISDDDLILMFPEIGTLKSALSVYQELTPLLNHQFQTVDDRGNAVATKLLIHNYRTVLINTLSWLSSNIRFMTADGAQPVRIVQDDKGSDETNVQTESQDD